MLVLVLGMVVSILDATILDHSLGVAILINGAQSGTITPTMRLAAATGTVILTALAFFPLYYLFLFSRRMLRALAGKNQSQLNQSFLELKKCMRYLGILLLAGIAVFALVFVIAAMVSVA